MVFANNVLAQYAAARPNVIYEFEIENYWILHKIYFYFKFTRLLWNDIPHIIKYIYIQWPENSGLKFTRLLWNNIPTKQKGFES